jgi:AcrR family transcriptional regulator
MRIDLAKLQKIAGKRGLSLHALLAKAGVSKTAFYHLVHKSSVLPASLRALAGTLRVRPGVFLTEENPDVAKIRRILALTDRIVTANPKLDRDNVRLTLLLLEEEPVRRLRRSLIRGRKSDLHR